MRSSLFVALLATSALADVYMHNMRGSNDRLNEANQNRNNGNRLFDSQNNDKGGYCYTLGTPPMSYYEGSLLPLEWTAQHGCGNPKMECNMVLQYMCGQQVESDPTIQIRDGTDTTTIPDNAANFNAKTTTGLFTYGMHESYAYYQACKTRNRNQGLFIADRNKNQNQLTPNKQSAIFTRQNNNGNRNGFECPEERDYYPYWHPSPWKDIAVLTDDTSRCAFFQAESQNVKSRNQCQDANGKATAPNNKDACIQAGNSWVEVPSHGIAAPECLAAPWTRDNHLGNALNSGEQASYNWTLPTSEQESCISSDTCVCVLRLRYNISTGDIDGWGHNDFNQNGVANSPVTQDPSVPVMGQNLTLAVDTTQFGRTFQDRSHTFQIRPRPAGVNSYDRIYNLNVRGKRGNIVQTYPATEYDFVPTQLTTRQNDYIHFQWTGCDNNPANNAGEGTAGTDRSNIVQISGPTKNYPVSDDWYSSNTPLFEGEDLRTRMAHLDQVNCKSYSELMALNANTREQDLRNCMKLNAAGPHFDGGLVKMNKTGTFYYMSSRNNNFSNRGQKATITVEPLLPPWAIGLVVAGSALFVATTAAAGAMFYAQSHPHTPMGSKINDLLSKLRM